jgi:hypothetical protein
MLAESYIFEPDIIMFGCRAMTAIRPEPGRCPACGRGIHKGDDNRYCGVCDAVSPGLAARIGSARRAIAAAGRAEVAEKALKDRLRDLDKVKLSEVDRRRLWNGHKGGILAEAADVSNAAKVARDWLRGIGQVPNWSLVLPSRGGRREG